MQHNHSINLLNLKEFKETFLLETDDTIFIRIEKASNFEICPHCGCISDKIHSRRKQSVKDLPMRNKQVILALFKRRYRCVNSECNKVFAEEYEAIQRYQRMTNRLIENLSKESISNTFLATARRYGLTPTTIRRYFQNKAAIKLDKHTFVTPKIIAMDEFAGTTSKGKYHLAIGDPRGKKLLDILPSRDRNVVEEYLRALPGREGIKYVCIDMWKHFKNAIKSALPEAQIIIDKFHVVRNVNWALDKVRKRVTKQMPLECRRLIKSGWRLILANREKLNEKGERRLQDILEYSEELRLAYCLKEWFRCWYQAPTYEIARIQLLEWFEAVDASGIKEFLYVKKTIQNWQPQILNYFFKRVTNGFLEGKNNRIKVIKRNAYGFKSFDTFRAKVLLSQN